MTLARQLLGKRSETRLDAWLHARGWEPVVKNYFFRGGELDRVYRDTRAATRGESPKINVTKYLVAEVKGAWIDSVQQISLFSSEVYWQRFFKKKQIANLFRFGENWRLLGEREGHPTEVFVRLFVVVWIRAADVGPSLHRGLIPGKLEKLGADCILISVEPELVCRSQRSSCLQISSMD